MAERVWKVYHAVYVPAILSIIAVFLSIHETTWWYLAALPCIWLGSICAQPNLNLSDGCLAYLAMIIGAVVTFFFKPLGSAILAGTISGYYISVIEKTKRMRPATDEELAEFGRHKTDDTPG